MSEQANTTAAAEVSPEYLSDIRLRVRSSVDKLDGEIKDLILAARADLVRGGVLPARAADETDPLVKQAISTYVKAEFGLDNDDADKYRASFRNQKIALSMASEYIEPTEEV
ncbi:DNA-packaging protein [Lawsonibacter sp. DFI.6.74]|nr:DNA-packaging protein [Lawsonibacter sp. DFI.6.74]MCG4773123.1 DNA-packaging protein [Lawsonibacter sp. DFI.5.51]MCQ5027251.1 DNA-packaging protein [Oscillibacter valericigenes]